MTVILGIISSYILAQYEYFTCPIDYSETADKIKILDCERDELFVNAIYDWSIVRHGMRKSMRKVEMSL